MSEFVIKENMVVTNVERMLLALQDQSKQIITADDLETIKDYINNNDNTIFYFKNDLSELYSTLLASPDKVLIDTGVLNTKKQHLFISLLKDGTNEYRGYFIQTITEFFKSGRDFFNGSSNTYNSRLNDFQNKFKKILDENPERFLEFEVVQETPTVSDPYAAEAPKKDENYYKNIDMLTYTLEKLLHDNEWAQIEGLDRHIKVIGDQINTAIDKGLDDYFVINSKRDVIVNSGLMDKFGNPILIMYRLNRTYNHYRPECIIDKKQDFINYDFTKEQASKNITSITNIIAEELRNGISTDIDDYDISFDALKHILIDRRDRFPETANMLSEKDLSDKIKNALKEGVSKLQVDVNYAKPIYSTETKELSWLFPLRIFAGVGEEPEMVLVVRKQDDFYCLKTVLAYDKTLKDRIRSARLYQSEWK